MKTISTTMALLLGVSGTSFAENNTTESDLKLSGSLSLVSAYVSRGGTNSPENDDPALQAYLRADYQGWYTAYWVSKISYSFDEVQKQSKAEDRVKSSAGYNALNYDVSKSDDSNYLNSLRQQALVNEAVAGVNTSAPKFYEHDFFIGYANKINDWDYDINLATYYYSGKDTTGVEAGVAFSRPLSKTLNNSLMLSAQTYVNDTVYMNQWDSYFLVDYHQPLPQGFDLNLSAGVSWYQDEGKHEQGLFLNTQKDWVLRHLSAQVSKNLFNNPKATGWVKYVMGGESRSGADQKDMIVLGTKYSF